MPDDAIAGIEHEDFLELFLDESDAPTGVRRVQDTREQGPDPNDRPFARNRGLDAGFAVWMAQPEDLVWRIVDIRWSFPDSTTAAAYHAEALSKNSEGHPPVAGAPSVGSDSRWFGGTEQVPGLPITMTAFYCVFRTLNVVVKLFVAQGPAAKGQLTPQMVLPIATSIDARIRRVAAARV